MNPKKPHIAILGAGPIGMEAALYARAHEYPTVVYEAETVGSHLTAWGQVTLFTPWGLNVSPLGEERLEAEGLLPPGFSRDRTPTGREMVEQYLLPLTRLPELQGVLREETRVVSIGRGDLLKGDFGREHQPFRILVQGPEGETMEEADIVLDATGVFGQPNALGRGGIPAPGERALASHLDFGLPDILGKDRDRFEGKTVLVAGSGLSAATSVLALSGLNEGRVIWATRSGSPPIDEIENDPLPDRLSLSRLANALVSGSSPRFQHLPQHTVSRVGLTDDGFSVVLSAPDGERTVMVDRILVQTGFHPDSSIHRELQVHQCYASEGPMKLAASLLGAESADCMTQEGFGPESLVNPEPGFFIIGHKSYGRNPSFLLRIGREQVCDVFRLITGDPSLDLYSEAAERV